MEQYLQSQRGILGLNHHSGSTSHLQPRKDEIEKKVGAQQPLYASLAKTSRGKQQRIMRVFLTKFRNLYVHSIYSHMYTFPFYCSETF